MHQCRIGIGERALLLAPRTAVVKSGVNAHYAILHGTIWIGFSGERKYPARAAAALN
jgi:hypothetical protein